MALRSMTGFGQGVSEADGVRYEVSLRGVNHRFLDVSLKLPMTSPALEQELQRILREGVSRGRVDVSVSRTESAQQNVSVTIHSERLKLAASELRRALSEIGVVDERSVNDALVSLIRRDEFVEVRSARSSLDGEHQQIVGAFQEALRGFLSMREIEGQGIEAEMLRLISTLEELTKQIVSIHAQNIDSLRTRLGERIQKALQAIPVDEQRVVQEAAIMADRLDISEEMNRLASHFSQLRAVIQGNEGGKKIEFLLQEIGRELNTCGSKSQLSEISQRVVSAKSELEKMREQVQNVE